MSTSSFRKREASQRVSVQTKHQTMAISAHHLQIAVSPRLLPTRKFTTSEQMHKRVLC